MDEMTIVVFEDVQRQMIQAAAMMRAIGEIVWPVIRQICEAVRAAAAAFTWPTWRPPMRRRRPRRWPRWYMRTKP